MQKDLSNSGKKLNYLLFLFTFIASVIWWGIGEVFFSITKADSASIIRNPLLNGVYFAFLSLFTILACLLSEKIVHSIVEKDFFQEVVMTPSLKKILPAAFTMMLLAVGVLEFIYEFEPAPAKPAPTVTKEKTTIEVEDFYFVIDDSGSLTRNDPKNIRIDVLNNLIDGMSEDKRISLISFGGEDFARILQKLSPANSKGKKEFRSHVSRFNSDGPTTDILTALGLNEKLVDRKTARKAMVIMITDGENTDKGPNAPTPQYLVETYSSLKIPIFSIFLGSEYTDDSMAFLENISIPTGGKVILVEDMNNFQKELTYVVYTEQQAQPESKHKPEPLRDMLEMRTGKRQNSSLHIVMRIAFITLIGLLMGYLLYTVFSSSRIFISLLLGGGISGFLAGLILEISFQTYYLPDFIIRLLACVVLSILFWLVSFASGWVIGLKTSRSVFALWNFNDDMQHNILDSDQSKNIDNGVLDGKKKDKTNSAQGKLGK